MRLLALVEDATPSSEERPMCRGRRITVALFAGLLLTADLGGCSGSPPQSGKPPDSHRAVQLDRRADAAPLLTELIRRIDQQGSARSNVRGRLGFVGDLNSDGTVRYRGTQADVALGGDTQTSQTQPKQQVDLAIINGVGYVKSPLLLAEPGKPWIRVTPNGHDLGTQVLGSALEQLKHVTDPREAFAGVESATRIQSSARDAVDGRPTTRYDLRVNTARAAQIATDAQQRSRMRAAAEQGHPELEYQLWIDDSGLPARFTATRDVAQGQMSLTSFYSDWGVATDIEAPPAELVGVFPNAPPPGAQAPR
jgi:hypothetical protein